MLTVDSNVLIYAIDSTDPLRQRLALNLLAGLSSAPAFLTQQAVGEFCKVALRKRMPASDMSIQVGIWLALLPIISTSLRQLLAAADLVERRQKQFWDMVIVRVAADAGATILFTEDIGDGEIIEGVSIVNPFDPINFAKVAAILAG